jgi:hypothetical protein
MANRMSIYLTQMPKDRVILLMMKEKERKGHLLC